MIKKFLFANLFIFSQGLSHLPLISENPSTSLECHTHDSRASGGVSKKKERKQKVNGARNAVVKA